MADIGLHLSSPTTALLLQLNQNQTYYRFNHHQRILSTQSFPATLPPQLHLCKSRIWDSNAESYNTHNFNNDDENELSFKADLDGFDDVFDEYTDSIWIFKVFRSYGWMFPPILISILLANGLKAFLLALAIPFWVSTFSFAYQKMQNGGTNTPNLKTRNTKKGKSPAYRTRNVTLDEEEELFSRTKSNKEKYDSWVPKNDNLNDRSTTDFGGWDEVNIGIESNVGSSKRPAQKMRRLKGKPATRSTLRGRRRNGTPLLLRLLISIFPFFEFME